MCASQEKIGICQKSNTVMYFSDKAAGRLARRKRAPQRRARSWRRTTTDKSHRVTHTGPRHRDGQLLLCSHAFFVHTLPDIYIKKLNGNN